MQRLIVVPATVAFVFLLVQFATASKDNIRYLHPSRRVGETCWSVQICKRQTMRALMASLGRLLALQASAMRIGKPRHAIIFVDPCMDAHDTYSKVQLTAAASVICVMEATSHTMPAARAFKSSSARWVVNP